MPGDDNQTSEVEAVRGRLIGRVHRQVHEITEVGMSDVRSTERLLEVIEECAARETAETQEPSLDMRALLGAVRQLRLRGDLLVRARDLEVIVRPSRASSWRWGPTGNVLWIGSTAGTSL